MSSERLTVNGVVERRPVCRFTAYAFTLCVLSYFSPLTAQIQDNSFLFEEAYNQERGVVQHISTFARSSRGLGLQLHSGVASRRDPAPTQLHPSGSNDPDGTGLGDIGLNYRYQLVGTPEAPVVFAPRLSLLLPTGVTSRVEARGHSGFQANLPLSLVLSPGLVTHWNAGPPSHHPRRTPSDAEATTASFNLGGSAIWLLHPSVNLMLEEFGSARSRCVGVVRTRDETLLLNPGFAGHSIWRIFRSYPGIAYTFDV